MPSLQQAIKRVNDAALAKDAGEQGAHEQLLQAIDKLQLAAEAPTDVLSRIRRQAMPLAITRLVIENGLLQALSEVHDKPVTVAELGKKTNLDELLTLRLLRCVAGMGVVDEVGEATFAANSVTRYVVQPGQTGAIKYQHDLFFPMFSAIVPYLQKHGTIHQFPEKPGEENLFQYAFGDSIWSYLKSHQDWKRNFDAFMSYRHIPNPWYETYPVDKELSKSSLKDSPDSVLIVDVAGGVGHDIRAFREQYPMIPGRRILEDLPETLQKVSPDALPGIEIVPYDFYTAQPIKGARVYLFRRILHDWSDNQCRKFLANTVAAMDDEYSRLLIEDRILPSSGVSLNTALADLNMMFQCSGLERTESQFYELLGSVGLEVVKIWRPSSGVVEGVIETRKRRR